ncbi:hypothetical protein [Glutamicibacter sp. PS]|uniref:hypothetical protein n=1 Tax=Glutamicibacter sp. PS TaxID=3075634 RepID=UPI002852D946|nr:hypothetical protein [Glutamicibacter sp. PS]
MTPNAYEVVFIFVLPALTVIALVVVLYRVLTYTSRAERREETIERDLQRETRDKVEP